MTELKSKQEILSRIVKREIFWKDVPLALRQDEDIAISAMKAWPQQYNKLPAEMRKLESVVRQAAHFGQNLEHFPAIFKKNPEIVMACLSKGGNNLEYAHASLRKDKKIALFAIKKTPYAYRYVDESLKRDDEVVRTALAGQGLALEIMPQDIVENEKYFALALQYNSSCYKLGTSAFKENPIYINRGLEYGENLQHMPEHVRDNKEIVMKLLGADNSFTARMNAQYLAYCSERLKDDDEVVSLAISGDGEVIRFASQRIRDEEDFFFKICYSLEAITHMSDRIKSKPELFIKALDYEMPPEILRHYHPELLEDDEILFRCLKYYQATDQMYLIEQEDIVPAKWKKRMGNSNPLDYMESFFMKEKLDSALEEKREGKKKIKV